MKICFLARAAWGPVSWAADPATVWSEENFQETVFPFRQGLREWNSGRQVWWPEEVFKNVV